MMISLVAVASPVMYAFASNILMVSPLTALPVIPEPLAIRILPAELTSPVISEFDARMRTLPALTLPVTWLPLARSKIPVAVILPVKLTGLLVVMSVPLMLPLTWFPLPIETGPLEMILLPYWLPDGSNDTDKLPVTGPVTEFCEPRVTAVPETEPPMVTFWAVVMEVPMTLPLMTLTPPIAN